MFPHNLRHLFATVFYRVCRDIVKLADLLGHSSIETTRIYLVTSGLGAQRALEPAGDLCHNLSNQHSDKMIAKNNLVLTYL